LASCALQTGRGKKDTGNKVNAYNMWNSHQQSKKAGQGQGSASTAFSTEQGGGWAAVKANPREEAKWQLLAEVVNAMERGQ